MSLLDDRYASLYTVTTEVYANNSNIVNANLSAHSEATKDRIQQALDVGYEITIHDAPITQDGWTGAGFAMIDPATGAGGYLIDGGSNGAKLLLFAIGIGLFFAGAAPGLLLLYGIMVALFSIYAAILNAIVALDSGTACIDLVEAGLLISVALALIGIVIPSRTATGMAFGLMTSLYGGAAFNGIAMSRACR